MKEPKFKYLGDQGFPHANTVDVYKYENNIDYERFNYSQMKLTICQVPWDLGEAHIGNRTIDGVGNVVYFENQEKRDDWFNSIADNECFRFETKYKELHRDNTIKVPIPFDVASRYNYVFVEYTLFANDNSLLEFEKDDGVRKWCYFIRNVISESPNTTVLELMEDVWQTFIYDFDVTGMILERGHAPLFAIQTDEYLKNPINNCDFLLTEDVNFGDLQKVTKTQATVINDENLKACVATTSNILGDWENNIPAKNVSTFDGVPAINIFCCDAENLDAILLILNTEYPQFRETIKGVFFINKDLITLGTSFKLGSVECNEVISNSNQINRSILERSKSDWNYGSDYENIAKLYTFPYSAFEITDEKGKSSLIKIEETSDTLSINISANLVFPYLNLQGVIKGVGGNEENTIRFSNVTKKSFKSSGRWYDYLQEWQIPYFSVILDSSTHYDYSTRFDREQMLNDAQVAQTISNRNANLAKKISNRNTETDKDNSNRDATTTRDNTNRSASTTKTNSDNEASTNATNATNVANATKTIQNNNAQNILDNANAQVSANNTINTKGNECATSDCNLSNALSQALQAWDAGYTLATVNTESDAKAQSAAISSAGSMVNGAVNGAVSGATAGPAGAALGALTGLVSSGINAAVTGATTAIGINLEHEKANLAIQNSQDKTTSTNNNNTERTATANNAKTGQTSATNTMTLTSSANTASALRENASTENTASINATNATKTTTTENNKRQYDTSKTNNDNLYTTTTANITNTYNNLITNATDTYDVSIENAQDTYTNAQNRIQNLINQANLRAPLECGNCENAGSATTKPQALFVNIVTQSKGAIKQAGDEFLRYGYRFDQQWKFDGNWNIGKHFTYWKLKDYWVKGNNFQDYYQDALRFFLMGGVTVWRNPEDIGAVSIYDNFN